MNKFLSGGHEQGTSTTTPAEFVVPSQFPVPVGLRPAAWPNCGIRAAFTSRLIDDLLCGAGAADIDKTIPEKERSV